MYVGFAEITCVSGSMLLTTSSVVQITHFGVSQTHDSSCGIQSLSSSLRFQLSFTYCV